MKSIKTNWAMCRGFYILMHSNTGAFGNDLSCQHENAEMMEKYFSLNFNRQGTCLNMRDSSIYDPEQTSVKHSISPPTI